MFASLLIRFGKFLARKEFAQLESSLKEIEVQNTYNVLETCRLERNADKLQEALRMERQLRLTILEAAKNGFNVYSISGFVNARNGTTRINEFLAAETEQAAREKAQAKYPRDLIGARVLNTIQVATDMELKVKLEPAPMLAVADGIIHQFVAALSTRTAA